MDFFLKKCSSSPMAKKQKLGYITLEKILKESKYFILKFSKMGINLYISTIKICPHQHSMQHYVEK
jgi:hypothetical protein